MPKDNKKKSIGTSRASNRRGNAADVQKAISANTKKYNAMTPAQKKAYIAKQAKAIGKTTAQVVSMVGGAGLARAAAAKATIPAIKKAAAKSVEKKSLKAANIPAKGSKATKARARGEKYQSLVDSKDIKGRRQRYQTLLARKGPGWIGGNSYIKLPKK
jgi:hypothetical protein